MKTKKPYKFCFRSVIIIIICFSCFVAISAQTTGDDYHMLGETAEDNGELEEAIDYYILAATLYEEEEDLDGAAWSYFDAGEVSLKLENFENAYNHFISSAQLFEQDENPLNVTFSKILAGYSKYKLKQYAEAENIFKSAGDAAANLEAYGNAGYAYDGAGHAIKYSNWTSAQNYWNLAKVNFNKEGISYTIPSDLQIEVDNPTSCKILIGFFYSEMDTYKQGEGVTVSGSILYKGKSVNPQGNSISIELIVPDCDVPKSDRIKTDLKLETGKFTFIPFAGWNEGLYQIILNAQYYSDADQKLITVRDTSYLIIEPEELLTDVNSQTDEIIKEYKKVIPKGPIHTNSDAYNYVIIKSFGSIRSTFSDWGYLHNQYLARTEFDPNSNYTCEGYQGSVLKFFDNLRFSSDPDMRTLMKGLDYGPIQRNTVVSDVSESMDPYFHVAVVLYRIGTDWKTDPQAIVFDPWFNQEPCVYTMQEWKNKNALFTSFEPQVDRQMLSKTKPIWDGFPITNNTICSGLNTTIYSNVSGSNKTNVMNNCPVTILIIDSEGHKTGVESDGNFVQEFVANVYAPDKNIDSSGWFFELPENSYEIQITGVDDGEFHLHISGELVENEFLYYGTQPIDIDETATISLGPDIDKPALILPDGTKVEPISESAGIHEEYAKNNNNVLIQNHPNPFSEVTLISFSLVRCTNVKLEIFNISGKCINTLMNGFKNAGEHTVYWNGTDEAGTKVQSGMYLYKITTNNFTITQKIFLIR
jgi:tetratricopeptide (TPR) repeat protein